MNCTSVICSLLMLVDLYSYPAIIIDEDQHNFRRVNRILSSGREIQRASHPEREAAKEEGFDGREIATIVDGSQVDHILSQFYIYSNNGLINPRPFCARTRQPAQHPTQLHIVSMVVIVVHLLCSTCRLSMTRGRLSASRFSLLGSS
jgi:hypothetical protein